jgi:hypothetical protein
MQLLLEHSQSYQLGRCQQDSRHYNAEIKSSLKPS